MQKHTSGQNFLKTCIKYIALSNSSSEELFIYIRAMKDESILKLVAKFCFEVLTTFDSLLE